MIYDTLNNFSFYCKNEIWIAVANFLQNFPKDIADGHHQICENAYASVNSYLSKPIEDTVVESHRKYTDVQVLFEGMEQARCYDISNLIKKTIYNSEKDVMFYQYNNFANIQMQLKPGYFAIFFPQDIHQSQIMLDEQIACRKLVVKIKN